MQASMIIFRRNVLNNFKITLNIYFSLWTVHKALFYSDLLAGEFAHCRLHARPRQNIVYGSYFHVNKMYVDIYTINNINSSHIITIYIIRMKNTTLIDVIHD